ncbi:hypothetical protein GFS31_16250 [Leptolyngbya sp. BL0902]|nr:hypothetical protein GFS31_16250 [Leptolyngbya sp. BL0902]
MVLLTGSGLFCGWALLWLTRIPPLPDCDQITPFHSSSDMLYCAQAQARTGEPNNLTQAVLLTVNWPANDTNYDEAQEVLKDASEQILVLANRWAQAGRLEDAIRLAGTIPLNTPLRSSAQAVIFEWRQDWDRGQALEANLKAALSTQNWEQAKDYLEGFKAISSPYWNTNRLNFWHHQNQLEQQAWNQLLQARSLAATGTSADLQAAIALARDIDLRSQGWATAETEVNQWGKQLLAQGLTEWNNGNSEAALALTKGVPPIPDLDPAAADLQRLAQAQRLMAHTGADNLGGEPHYGHLLNLMEAMAAVQQISPGSAFAAASQPNLDTWHAHLEDLQRLKFSTMVAKAGRRMTYQWAEAQALQVEVERPRRIQGQTLISTWRANLERIEDRPILIQARAIAQPGTIPALRSAMDRASQVELGRALRGEAQTLIAAWRDEIQVIEDRPMLDAAVALANQGKLREAIQEAQKIGANRALHSRAQTLVQDWTTELQIAEDRPILDRAKNLAYAGSLTAAINLASQIAPGRALHAEARSAIARWQAERAYIWSIWEAEGRSTPTSANSPSSDSE